MNSVLTWEYIAGFFDGEGCISKRHNGNPSKMYHRASVVQSGERGLILLQEIQRFLESQGIWTGKITVINFKKENAQTGYALVIGARESIRRFLKQLLPFLHIKRVEAEVALQELEGLKGLSHKRAQTKQNKENYIESIQR